MMVTKVLASRSHPYPRDTAPMPWLRPLPCGRSPPSTEHVLNLARPMRLRMVPPDGFTAEECLAFLRQVLRTRTRGNVLHDRSGKLELVGPIPDLVPLKFLLRRFGYRFHERGR